MRYPLLSTLFAILLGFVPELPAASPTVASLGYSYNLQAEWSPFIQGKTIETSLSLYSSTKKPFIVSFSVFEGENKTVLYRQEVDFEDEMASISYSYAAQFTSKSKIKLGVDADVYDYGAFHTVLLFSKQIVIEESLRAKDEYVPIAESQTYYCPETYIVRNYDGISPEFEYTHPSYEFCNADYVKSVGKRSMGLTDYIIKYDDGFGNSKMNASCYLRCLDHISDFYGFEDKGGYGEKRIYPKEKLSDGEYSYTLGFLPYLYYDKFKLSICKESSTSYGFKSGELFIPIGFGHDYDPYCFSIIATFNDEDSFVLNRKVITSSLHFGACEDADYCVIGDMDA